MLTNNSHDEATPQEANPGLAPRPPDDRPDNPLEAVVAPPGDVPMEIEEIPPIVNAKGNSTRNARQTAEGPFVFGSQDPAEATRTRKKPKKTQNPTPTPPANGPNNAAQDGRAAWVQHLSSLTQDLSTQLNSIQQLPTDPELRRHLKSIQRVLFESSESLATALGLTNRHPEPHHPQTQSNNDSVLKAIRDFTERLEAQETMIRNIKKQSPKPTQTPQNTPTPAPGLSYAQATTTPRPNQPVPPANQKQTPPSTKPPSTKTADPSTHKKAPRYVVRFGKNPPPFADRLSSERATNRLNDRFRDLPTSQGRIKVVATNCKPNGNYIVTFSDDSPATLVEEHKNQLLHVLAPHHPSAIVSRDDPWTKVIVHGISLRDDNLFPRTDESLLEAIGVNSCLNGITITQPPRWILPPDRLEGKRASAISFAFLDKPNSILPTLLSSPFHMFGAPKRVSRWREILKPIQCKRCWKFHYIKDCRAKLPKCRRCGKPETEDKHAAHCDDCKSSPDENVVCTHSSCLNCHQIGHCADDPNCPKLAARLALPRYILPRSQKDPLRNERHPSQ
jgi:hypothetical protein